MKKNPKKSDMILLKRTPASKENQEEKEIDQEVAVAVKKRKEKNLKDETAVKIILKKKNPKNLKSTKVEKGQIKSLITLILQKDLKQKKAKDPDLEVGVIEELGLAVTRQNGNDKKSDHKNGYFQI